MTFEEWWLEYDEQFRLISDDTRFCAAKYAWHAAQAACAAGPWQPIKDAPKDGTRVLAMNNEGSVGACTWDKFHKHWYDDVGYLLPDPTHFAPLREVQR